MISFVRQELIAAAIDAAYDEVEHAAVMRELARMRGVAVARVECGAYRPVSLLELAVHSVNASLRDRTRAICDSGVRNSRDA